MASGVQIIWTPWRSHDEVLRVREWLYATSSNDEPSNRSLRQKACDQISAWKLRGHLPHAVESTWLLTEAVLTDEVSADLLPLFAVKAAYITAISRFVTGLLDSQQESKFKVSMYAKAQQIGLPAAFVDLRHEATHGDMPSLTNLRGAAQRALQWLWDDYWTALAGQATVKQGKEPSNLVETDMAVQPSPDQGSAIKQATGNGYDQEVMVVAPNAQPESGNWQKWPGQWGSRPIGT